MTYTIHKHHSHYGWDNNFEPVQSIKPGETVSFETIDASGAQLNSKSTIEDVVNLDFGKVNPVTGPVFIEGAEPGDALKVSIKELKPSGWGWTANIPGFGLLADEFKDPYLKIWELDKPKTGRFLDGINVPLKAFPGTIGVAPAEAGHHSVVPPRHCGGNMDIRDLGAGVNLYLPVQVSGALFSVGDTHAAQGDGEVCGTAIESPMEITLGFDLIKGANLHSPQFETPGPVTRHLDEKGYYVTTGIGPDLFKASQDAVRSMIDHLGKTYKLSPEDAYLLCSVACDLRISEIVDMPNWLVSFYLPLSLFA
ncbi:MAG: acetamidase/formamidase family protein [Trueperaceae bacterium]|nr:acetamidase/formamidase family protein [Trueperaceae bacterium]